MRRCDLAGFDVGLIEGVDADDRARDGGRNLPAEEFLPQVVDVGDGDPNDRVPGFFERRDFGVLRGVGRGFQTKVGEDAIVAINVGRAECFAIDRDDALAQFAGGFGDQLFQPRAEIGNSGRGDDA